MISQEDLNLEFGFKGICIALALEPNGNLLSDLFPGLFPDFSP